MEFKFSITISGVRTNGCWVFYLKRTGIESMSILDIIASKNYIIYNKTLAKELGVESAIVFGVLCDYQRFYGEQEFYKDQNQIIEDTALTKYAVRTAIAKLKEMQLISAEVKGVPARYFYKINEEKLSEMLSSQFCENEKQDLRNRKTRSVENENLYTREKEAKRENIKTNIQENNNKKEIIKEISYFDDPELNTLFVTFLDLRKKLKAQNTAMAIKLLLNKLNNYDDSTKKLMIEQSIENSWKSVFPIKYSVEKKESESSNTIKTKKIGDWL